MTSRPPFPTLRDLAGLPTDPTPLAESTLLVIDAQLAYSSSGALPLPDIDAALVRIDELLSEARRRKVPIIHVAHTGAPGTPFDPNNGGRFITEATPLAGEDVVTKALPNAFAGTTLRQRVEQLGRPLVICGFMTHMCVASTARAALDLGIETNVVADATATRSLPSPISGESIPAATIHSAAIAALADRFSVVAPTSAFIDSRSPQEISPNGAATATSHPLEENTMSTEITIKSEPAVVVAAHRTATTYGEVFNDIPAGFAAVMTALSVADIGPAGIPFTLYHQVPDGDTAGDIAMCVPVATTIGDATDGVETIELAAERAASVVHLGSYDDIGKSYAEIASWIHEHGHSVVGPTREVYLNSPAEVAEADLRTEILFPIDAEGES